MLTPITPTSKLESGFIGLPFSGKHSAKQSPLTSSGPGEACYRSALDTFGSSEKTTSLFDANASKSKAYRYMIGLLGSNPSLWRPHNS